MLDGGIAGASNDSEASYMGLSVMLPPVNRML